MGVARALAASSDLILMDEPFGALDPITRRDLQGEFRDLQRRLGTTVILVTHDLREACRLGDRLALLHEGRLMQTGAASEFLREPADAYVREFFLERPGRRLWRTDMSRLGPVARFPGHRTMVAALSHGRTSRSGASKRCFWPSRGRYRSASSVRRPLVWNVPRRTHGMSSRRSPACACSVSC